MHQKTILKVIQQWTFHPQSREDNGKSPQRRALCEFNKLSPFTEWENGSLAEIELSACSQICGIISRHELSGLAMERLASHWGQPVICVIPFEAGDIIERPWAMIY